MNQLTYPNVKFTRADIRTFALRNFETWKKRFNRETNAEKMEKYVSSTKKNRRKQRQKSVSINDK